MPPKKRKAADFDEDFDDKPSAPPPTAVEGFEAFQDLSHSLTLKPDHEKRPIWVTKDNMIILEAFSKHYTQAYDFLINIAEPIARPTYFHTYRLTEDSLYSAIAVSRDAESIIKYLRILCKTEVPSEVENYIRKCTETFGLAKLVLKDNNFFIESRYANVLLKLLENPIIQAARIMPTVTEPLSQGTAVASTRTAEGFVESMAPIEDRRNVDFIALDEEDGNEGRDEELGEGGISRSKTVSFMVSQEMLKVIGNVATWRYYSLFQTIFSFFSQLVKQSAKVDSKCPLMEEYDFRADVVNPNLVVDLRPSTTIRVNIVYLHIYCKM